MIVGIPKETNQNENRVAATPDTVQKLCAWGMSVVVEKSAGDNAYFTDEAYRKAGAKIVDAKDALSADIIFKVNRPSNEEIKHMKKRAALFCIVDACTSADTLDLLAKAQVDTFALERVPRISRAQSVDVLSSQSNIAGYRAALTAAQLYTSFMSMMMTSAGSAKPAKAMVLGAGVAGLQAIATVKKLGARVFAYDVRPEVKEQVESLGATFVELKLNEDGAGEGGYAKQLSKEAQEKQKELLGEELKKMDIIISTALIPCRRAPVLITEDVVKAMKPGSVIVDMAASSGGNCTLSEADKTVVKHGVTIFGETNFPATMSTDASAFYAKNLFNFLSLLVDDKKINGSVRLKDYCEDEITCASLVTHNGEIRLN